ncbi:MAG: LysR family transcriptional regulator [Lachnospiraceae bacterium]|nr:LysR family transcriptional regulator [Lachnospiraceae bacterium]
MELKSLQYLESVYRNKSFTKAASEFYISQPSISVAMQKLENELGVTLIDRNAKPLAFTEDGERFMHHVYNILDAVENAVNDMQHRTNRTEQMLSCAWATTLGDIIRPTIYTTFFAKHPDYQIIIKEGTQKSIEKELLDGSLDMAYTHIPDSLNPELFETIPIQISETSVLMSRKHPLASEPDLCLKDLREERILIFPKGSMIRSKIEDAFHRAYVVPDFYTVSFASQIYEMICSGFGIALFPVDRVNSLSEDNQIAVIPLREHITFLKGFILKRGVQRTRAMQDLIDHTSQLARCQ